MAFWCPPLQLGLKKKYYFRRKVKRNYAVTYRQNLLNDTKAFNDLFVSAHMPWQV